MIADAPGVGDSLDAESTEFFAAVRAGLDALGIAYGLNSRLVRGLDYYCHTAFEFTTDALGAQGTVIAGGRYDGLISTMGGPEPAGVGWAAGIERLALLLDGEANPARPIAVIPLGAAAETAALPLAERLRRGGLPVDLGYRGNLKRRMNRANKINARAAVIIGDDELAQNSVTLRDLDSGEQTLVPLDALDGRLASIV